MWVEPNEISQVKTGYSCSQNNSINAKPFQYIFSKIKKLFGFIKLK